jgi:hypothetical protein
MLALASLLLFTSLAYSENPVNDVPARSLSQTNRAVPPVADGGGDIVTFVSKETILKGYGSSINGYVVRYEWDFDGDGQYDWESEETGLSIFDYKIPGKYNAVLRVTDSHGNVGIDFIDVQVKPGSGNQKELIKKGKQDSLVEQTIGTSVEAQSAAAGGDGIIQRYALMINGANEVRFWDDVTFMYSTLINDYQFASELIYLFNYNGTDPSGANPNNMIDYPATRANIDAGFAQLGAIMDSDDELFVWITGHGRGYNGPASEYYGYMDGSASVDPGDEQDYLESEFKLRSLHTGGNYSSNHGMEEWKVYYQYYSSGNYRMWRQKYVSHFNGIYFESIGKAKKDNDIFIERFADYLEGDYNRNGVIETTIGEVYDYDGDGIPPYNPGSDVFDEDDWGSIDYYDDDVTHINTQVPGSSYIIFDANQDNLLDIDIDYDINNLQVDGTDFDNMGFFDGVDINSDGDKNDWVSVDELIQIYGDKLSDDDMAVFVDRVNAKVISIFAQQCFSGGLVEDLSGQNRVISTASTEETLSYGNLFVMNFTSAFHWANSSGFPVNADYDGNGLISIQEAFNYATLNDYFNEIPQYDDNGDGISHTYPIPAGGDGNLGANVYFTSSDMDTDGIFDDGDSSGIAGDNPCTGGNTFNCDDNCLDIYNPNQADSDYNGIGDLCDNSMNSDPVADAGPDITISSADISTTIIQGTVTDADPDDILLCAWEDEKNLQQLTPIMNVGPNGECPLDLSALSLGSGTFMLTLYGMDGTVTVKNKMILTINSNSAPVADAGPDITISSADISTTIIQGTVTDADPGDTILCAWEDENLQQLIPIMNVGPNGECPLDLSALSLTSGTYIFSLYGLDATIIANDKMVLTIF